MFPPERGGLVADPTRANAESDRLLADAAALERLAEYPEWAVFERIMAEHAERLGFALRTRGLDLVATEALRAELEAVDWFRHRHLALRRAVEDHETLRVSAGARGKER